MRRVLVTGSSRGIGLELVRQLVEREDRVFGGYRDASTASRLLKLSAFGRMSVPTCFPFRT